MNSFRIIWGGGWGGTLDIGYWDGIVGILELLSPD